MKATIFEIKRFAVHDGDGIRTTVFFKGCPLRCVWCHNPEGLTRKRQLAYYAHKCVGCKDCAVVCTENAHIFRNDMHEIDRSYCRMCGECEKVCLNQAIKVYGSEVTVEELLPVLLEDKEFYDNSGGGITLSGGECLMQADFSAELLKRLNQEGVHTAVDTCGFVPRAAFDKVMPYTDIFLYDIKAIDENVHIACTGQSNRQILENLKYVDRCGKASEIRIPYVPEFNADQIGKIAEFLGGLRNLTKVRVLPYHSYAGSKYKSLGMKNELPQKMPDEMEMKAAQDIIRAHGIAVV